ncbi:MAG TPA: PepSY-like domain-containing protein [Puia sp.]|jgi:hypothetical protein|nr:PepSY-like domain-containing protein [Puia sp.]
MKKLFFLLLSAALMTGAAYAKIPAKITDAFHSRYVDATNVEWRHGIIGDYKARFNMGEYLVKARFDRKGRWLGSEKILSENMLPEAVKTSLKKSRYGLWKIRSSYEQYLPNEKPSYHITAAKGDLKRKSLVFDHHGELMNG